MNQSSVIGQTWRLVWQRKSLLALGLLSALVAVLGVIALYGGLVAAFLSSPELLTRMVSLPEEALQPWPFPRGLLGLGVAGGIFWFLLWLVGLAARGGLIAAVDDIEDGRSPTFSDAFGRGWRRVLTLAAMSFVLFLPLLILYALAQAIVLANLPDFMLASPEDVFDSMMRTYGFSLSLSGVNFLVALFLQFIYPFAYRGVMLRDLGVWSSITHGWRVLRANLGEIVPLAMIFGGLLLLLLIVWYAGFFALYIFLIIALAAGLGGPSMAIILLLVAAILLLLLFLIAAWGILTTWRSAAFTASYRRWTATS
jgi:hypothetical protein